MCQGLPALPCLPVPTSDRARTHSDTLPLLRIYLIVDKALRGPPHGNWPALCCSWLLTESKNVEHGSRVVLRVELTAVTQPGPEQVFTRLKGCSYVVSCNVSREYSRRVKPITRPGEREREREREGDRMENSLVRIAEYIVIIRPLKCDFLTVTSGQVHVAVRTAQSGV